MTCPCGKPLTGRQRKWCSRRCSDKGWYWAHNTRQPPKRITDAKLAEVKTRFPSCARDWDVAMVEQAWPRLLTLLPKRLAKLDKH